MKRILGEIGCREKEKYPCIRHVYLIHAIPSPPAPLQYKNTHSQTLIACFLITAVMSPREPVADTQFTEQSM